MDALLILLGCVATLAVTRTVVLACSTNVAVHGSTLGLPRSTPRREAA